MKLQYDFLPRVRLLYLYHTACFLCGRNYPLEIHHILGRVSDSAFNSSCLCNQCHSHVGHTRQEHQLIFFHTINFLYNVGFKPLEEDMKFLSENAEELISPQSMEWISKLP